MTLTALTSLDSVGTRGAIEPAAARGGAGFSAALGRAVGDHGPKLAEAACELVSTAFVVPAIESLHNSPLRPQSGPFALGIAEKRFAPLLEQRLADSVVKAANFGLVDAIIARISGRKGSP